MDAKLHGAPVRCASTDSSSSVGGWWPSLCRQAGFDGSGTCKSSRSLARRRGKHYVVSPGWFRCLTGTPGAAPHLAIHSIHTFREKSLAHRPASAILRSVPTSRLMLKMVAHAAHIAPRHLCLCLHKSG